MHANSYSQHHRAQKKYHANPPNQNRNLHINQYYSPQQRPHNNNFNNFPAPNSKFQQMDYIQQDNNYSQNLNNSFQSNQNHSNYQQQPQYQQKPNMGRDKSLPNLQKSPQIMQNSKNQPNSYSHKNFIKQHQDKANVNNKKSQFQSPQQQQQQNNQQNYNMFEDQDGQYKKNNYKQQFQQQQQQYDEYLNSNNNGSQFYIAPVQQSSHIPYSNDDVMNIYAQLEGGGAQNNNQNKQQNYQNSHRGNNQNREYVYNLQDDTVQVHDYPGSSIKKQQQQGIMKPKVQNKFNMYNDNNNNYNNNKPGGMHAHINITQEQEYNHQHNSPQGQKRVKTPHPMHQSHQQSPKTQRPPKKQLQRKPNSDQNTRLPDIKNLKSVQPLTISQKYNIHYPYNPYEGFEYKIDFVEKLPQNFQKLQVLTFIIQDIELNSGLQDISDFYDRSYPNQGETLNEIDIKEPHPTKKMNNFCPRILVNKKEILQNLQPSKSTYILIKLLCTTRDSEKQLQVWSLHQLFDFEKDQNNKKQLQLQQGCFKLPFYTEEFTTEFLIAEQIPYVSGVSLYIRIGSLMNKNLLGTESAQIQPNNYNFQHIHKKNESLANKFLKQHEQKQLQQELKAFIKQNIYSQNQRNSTQYDHLFWKYNMEKLTYQEKQIIQGNKSNKNHPKKRILNPKSQSETLEQRPYLKIFENDMSEHNNNNLNNSNIYQIQKNQKESIERLIKHQKNNNRNLNNISINDSMDFQNQQYNNYNLNNSSVIKQNPSQKLKQQQQSQQLQQQQQQERPVNLYKEKQIKKQQKLKEEAYQQYKERIKKKPQKTMEASQQQQTQEEGEEKGQEQNNTENQGAKAPPKKVLKSVRPKQKYKHKLWEELNFDPQDTIDFGCLELQNYDRKEEVLIEVTFMKANTHIVDNSQQGVFLSTYNSPIEAKIVPFNLTLEQNISIERLKQEYESELDQLFVLFKVYTFNEYNQQRDKVLGWYAHRLFIRKLQQSDKNNNKKNVEYVPNDGENTVQLRDNPVQSYPYNVNTSRKLPYKLLFYYFGEMEPEEGGAGQN